MVGYKVPLNTDLGSDAKKVQKEEQRRIDEAEELTEDEQEEKEDLLLQVSSVDYTHWKDMWIKLLLYINVRLQLLLRSTCYYFCFSALPPH